MYHNAYALLSLATERQMQRFNMNVTTQMYRENVISGCSKQYERKSVWQMYYKKIYYRKMHM